MKNYFVIQVKSRLVSLSSSTWYLCKNNPRRSSSGSSYSAFRPQLKYARKFKTKADAEKVLEQFYPAIFDKTEKIAEINNLN